MNRFLVAEICFCVAIAVAGVTPAIVLVCCVLAALLYGIVKTIVSDRKVMAAARQVTPDAVAEDATEQSVSKVGD